jgi:septum site-determining protein MinC
MIAEPSTKKSLNAFQLKGTQLALTVMVLLDAEPARIAEQLAGIISQSPRFFQATPVVLDFSELSALPPEYLNLSAMVDTIRREGLIPIGIRTPSDGLKEQAQTAGIAVFHTTQGSAEGDKRAAAKTNSPSLEASVASEKTKTKVITQPVRSGQQIYAQGGDLIILSSVSHGAEILADGHIHVYGALRGRVLAGINGDTAARIFCRSLEAELIAIAGRYLVSENLDLTDRHNSLQIFLENDQLKITAL